MGFGQVRVVLEARGLLAVTLTAAQTLGPLPRGASEVWENVKDSKQDSSRIRQLVLIAAAAAKGCVSPMQCQGRLS